MASRGTEDASSSSSGPTTQPQPHGGGGDDDYDTAAAAGPSAQTPTAPAPTSTVETSTVPAPTSTSPVKTPTTPASSSTSPVKTPTTPVPTSTSTVETSTAPVPTSTSTVETSTAPASSSTSTVQTSTAPAVPTSTTSPVKTSTAPVPTSTTSPVKTSTAPVPTSTTSLVKTAPAPSSTTTVTPAATTDTATDLSSPQSLRQKEKLSDAIFMLLSAAATPSSPAANKKGAAVGPSSSLGSPAERTQTTSQVSPTAVQKANNRPAERGGQTVSKIPVMWSPEKVKGAALGLLAKRWSSQPAGQTPDRTAPPPDLSSSPQKENISEDAPPSKMKENISEDAPPSKMKENISEDGAPPAKMARLCSDAAVAALSAAMGLLAKSPPPAPPLLAKTPPTAPPPASSSDAKQRAARHSYAKQIKALTDASPAIMRRYRPTEPPTSPAIMRRYKPRPPRNAGGGASSAAVRRNKAVEAAQPSPAIMRRKTFRSKVKLEGTSSPLTSPKSGQKAYDRRGDARQKANTVRSAPKFNSPSKFKVTGAVFCEGRVMGLLATRPIAGASTSSAAVKQRTESPPPAQRAVKRAADRGGQTVAWSAEKVKGATMGLLAKTSDPLSSTQSIQKADERQTFSQVPVTWSPEKVKGVLSLVAKRAAPSSSSGTSEMETEDSLAVLRLRQRIIRPQRKVVKKGPLQKIAHYVKLGHLNKLPGEIMALPGLYDQVVTEVMKRVKEECARVTRSAFGSVLRQTSLQSLKNFRWEDLVEEWRRSAPTFLRFLQSAASVSLDGGGANSSSKEADTAEAKTKKRVAAMAGAMVLHARSRHMRAPMVRNSLLLHAGDKKRCFQRFRTQGLCVSYKQTLTKVKEMGDTYDKEVLQWKEDAIAGGKPQQQAAAAASAGEDHAALLAAAALASPQAEPLLLVDDGGENNMAAGSSAGHVDVVVDDAATTTITITAI